MQIGILKSNCAFINNDFSDTSSSSYTGKVQVTLSVLNAFYFLAVDLSAVRISIVDQNDNEPEFPGDFNFEIAEDASIGAEVGTVTAIDADSSKLDN